MSNIPLSISEELQQLQSEASFHASKVEAEIGQLRSALAAKEQEALGKYEMLLEEVQNAFQESEEYFEQWKKAEATNEDLLAKHSALSQEKDALDCRISTLFSEREALDARLATLSADHSALASQAEADTTRFREELQARQVESLQKYEMLLGEVQKAFQESEEYFEQWKKTESLLPPFSLECEKIALGEQRNIGPHRSWDITFHQVSLLGRRWAQLDLRLVEHHGNAGILIFEGPGPSPALHRWNPNGEEGGRRFLLVVPQDHTSQTLLASVPASDLVFLRDATSKIIQEAAIQDLPHAHSLLWLQVARRLLQHFNEVPSRIYYDAVKTSVLSKPNGQPALRFELVNAYYAGKVLPSLPLVWKTSESKIHMESSTGNAGPLLAWPSSESGEPAAEVVFDLEDAPLARKTWSNWLKQDQRLVSFLIKEFPNFLHHFFEQHPESPLSQATLQKQARQLSLTLTRITAGKRPGIWRRIFRK